jgi:Ca2+-binding EF-hand superfamily protein
MFSLFDHDHTGFILTDDLGTVLRGLGRNLTEERVATLINAYDGTGSGKIDFQTFYTLMCENAPMPGPCYEAQVLRDFHVFDTYRDGQTITENATGRRMSASGMNVWRCECSHHMFVVP